MLQWFQSTFYVLLLYYYVTMNTEVFISVALVTCAISYFVYYRWRFFTKAVNIFPGPKTFPFIGNSYLLVRRNLDDMLYILDTIINTYPSPMRFWIGNIALIGIKDPDQIKIVLQSCCFDKSIFYDTTKSLLGVGLITSPTSTWSVHRRMVNSVFNANSLQGFFNKFVKQSLLFTDKLEKLNGTEIMLYKPLVKCTFGIASETLTDTEFKPQTIDQAIEVFYSWKENWNNMLLATIWNINTLLNFFNGSLNRGISSIRTIIMKEIIQQNECMFNKLDTSESNHKKEKNFFTYFWEKYREEKLTQEEFYDNIITILLAASETTATVMNFVIIMLANFPEIQEKVYEELSGIYGTKSPKSVPVKYQDLKHMDYLNRIIKETMRMFPPIPVIGRLLTENLQIGEFILPKGVNVIIPILNLHRNEKYWRNPLVFDPDRFLPKKKVDSANYYIPFSDGRRNCIGMKYSLMSMTIILTNLIRTFEFKLNKRIEIDEIKLKMNITIEAIDPIKIKIKKRSFQ